MFVLEFFGNNEDQRISGNFVEILRRLRTIKLTDRLNFAQRLLTHEQKKVFLVELEATLCQLPYLENLHYFHQGKSQEKQIKSIFQNYLDEYGDLKTIAALSNYYQYPSFYEYIENYREVLMLSFQDDELADLEYELGSFKLAKEEKPINPYECHFFHRLRVEEEKILDPNIQVEVGEKCVVCYQALIKQESYVECSKCGHKGHLTHILSWFEKF